MYGLFGRLTPRFSRPLGRERIILRRFEVRSSALMRRKRLAEKHLHLLHCSRWLTLATSDRWSHFPSHYIVLTLKQLHTTKSLLSGDLNLLIVSSRLVSYSYFSRLSDSRLCHKWSVSERICVASSTRTLSESNVIQHCTYHCIFLVISYYNSPFIYRWLVLRELTRSYLFLSLIGGTNYKN